MPWPRLVSRLLRLTDWFWHGMMKIDGATFGSITIEDLRPRRAHPDVGEGREAQEETVEAYLGTSHTLSEDEAKFVVENACKQLIFGTGHDAMAPLSPEGQRSSTREAARSSL